VGGTSGGPWLVQTTRGTRIVGVIGGYEPGRLRRLHVIQLATDPSSSKGRGPGR
jgi:hypothetical protein